jgi:hypothetical protein
MGIVRRPARRISWRARGWLAGGVLVVAILMAIAGRSTVPRIEAASGEPVVQTAPAQAVDLEAKARVVCGGCHKFPPPDILPRGAWRDEFVRMMFIRDGRLPPLGPPGIAYKNVQLPQDMEQVLPFYTERAPERLPAPEAWPDPGQSPLRFVRRTLAMAGMPGTPAVSNVQVVDLDGDKRLDILGTDMRQGVVFTARAADGAALSILASIPHPAHVSLADIDGDGLKDLLIGDLGGFLPADHDKGAVIWLRALAIGKYSAFWLDGWPRVADVEGADFNGDGRLDLAVAAFGWRKTGRVSVLENRPAAPSRPDFVEHVVDKRSGGIQIVPADLNRDGRMDFVTLLAQEHETVLAYINRGTGFAFEQKVIYTAPHPNWGSSGIQLVDLDKDGDHDVLFTHGDTFDDGVVKPYHGIQWLENTGSYPFVDHTLAAMPGVHRASAADLDGDGDLDIVAASLLAAGSDVDETRLPALAWLEQTRPRTFVRHTIEMGRPRHATLDVADIDDDGDLDIVAGNFSMEQASGGWIDVWVNQRK